MDKHLGGISKGVDTSPQPKQTNTLYAFKISNFLCIPDNPQQQVLRGPAGEEAAGGQQGVLQPRVPQPLNVNSTTSSLLPPDSLQQQVLQGPAGEEAGGGQVSHQQLDSSRSETSPSTLLPPVSLREQLLRCPAREEAGWG